MSTNDSAEKMLAERAERLAAARAFIERWSVAGAAIDAQRCRELQELDDATARRMTLDLFQLWRPSERDDMGAGMVAQQNLFEKLRQREAEGTVRR